MIDKPNNSSPSAPSPSAQSPSTQSPGTRPGSPQAAAAGPQPLTPKPGPSAAAAVPPAKGEPPKAEPPRSTAPAQPSSPISQPPPSQQMSTRTPPAASAPGAPTSSARPVLAAIGFLLLFAGLAWIWSQQRDAEGRAAALASRLDGLEAQLRGSSERMGALEQRPVPAPPPAADLRPLEQRLAALENRPAPVMPPPPAPVDLRPLEQRLATVESRPPPPPPDPALPGRLAALEQAETASKARADRLVGLQAAAAALEAGRPLGQLAGAPLELLRFAGTAPPREADLRLEFPAVAARALAATRRNDVASGMADRVVQKFQSLVTVRNGDRVLVGPPAATTLAEAETQLNAGNLAGGVAALDGLDPAAAAAVADWRDRGRALLAARTALAGMMGKP